jgi:phosphate transport system substrate-binding protein
MTSNRPGTRLAVLLATWALGLSLGLGAPGASAEPVSGAGSSAAAPVYRAWASAYGQAQPGFQLAYQSVGSSAGLKAARARSVGFGASDVAPPEKDLANDALVLVPTFVTGAVPVINLPRVGNGKLRLSGDVLAAIFRGEITRWNAPEIQSLNPGLALPDLPVRPVVRSDGSGTTYYFTDYLSKISPAWKEKSGAKTAIDWPASFMAAKGSDGVSRAVRDTAGAIGYIDFDYVTQDGLNPVQLRNAAGEFVTPGVDTFRAALRGSEWYTSGNFHGSLANMPGFNAWPITMGTFILLPKVSDKPEEAARAIRFFVWALLKGDPVVEHMGFVRLPDKMQALAFKALTSVTNQSGQAIALEAMSEFSRP